MANVSSSNGLEKRPKLRFPGFDEPWENRKFSSVFSFLQNNTLSRSELDTAGKVLNIHYGDVLIKYGSVLDASDQTIPYIVPGNESPNYVHLQDGDVVIADTAEDETVGKTTEIYNVLGSKIEAGLHTIPCRPMIPFAPKYLGYYMNTSCYHKQLIPLMQGIKVLSVSKGNISKTEISAPNSLEEQKKISSLLYLLDQRAAIQSKIIEALKKYKRGVVRSLLSPEDRKLKNAQWSRDTIGNLGSFIKGAPLSKADISKTGTPFILYGELYTTYHEVITSVVRKTEAEVDSVYRSIVGDVLIPTSGETPEEISTASCVMLPGVILAGDLNIFRSSKVDGRIMSYILNHIVNGSIARVAQGKSIVHVQASEISKIEISYPDPETQDRIVRVLEAISSRVEYCEKELDNLTKMRGSLLQQLFI
ncbi:restriction endonuclease subunit S [Lachnoclostridium edouardi]|uniref:restriction endonuclease subunit S n=1 Tax=Lachnoclostridium edouardi TaxID=1926283 RepID=UPI0011AFCCE3|nr:restriction endonuclease subunit S [Lachnoclostridium edouardi]